MNCLLQPHHAYQRHHNRCVQQHAEQTGLQSTKQDYIFPIHLQTGEFSYRLRQSKMEKWRACIDVHHWYGRWQKRAN